MHDKRLVFVAEPSVTTRGAWIGVVLDRIAMRVCMQTIFTYPSADEARFGARRGWAIISHTSPTTKEMLS